MREKGEVRRQRRRERRDRTGEISEDLIKR